MNSHALPPAPEHGGRLRRAASAHDIPLEQWLDLSTGVSPFAYPHLDDLDVALWQRLPEDEDGLAALAARHYGARHALPLAGSQAAIQLLPRLRPACRVGLVHPGYAEHEHAWQRHGHDLTRLDGSVTAIEAAIEGLDVLLLINPNNPTGTRYSREQLLGWQRRLAARGGWLVVDEAFADATPESSLAHASHREGLVVLRSLGKFYGLAGARVGFLLAAPELLDHAAYELGPWTLNGPAREIARRALADGHWQQQNRQRLRDASTRLSALLEAVGLRADGHCALFAWVRHPAAAELQQALARHAILVRLFTRPASLRFGLPASERDWQRLAEALARVMAEVGA